MSLQFKNTLKYSIMSQPTRILSRTARSLRWPPPISHTTTRTFQAQNVFQNDSASISRTDNSIKGTSPDPELAENKPLSFTPTLPTFSLAGKVAVITGGARGLGLAMSQALVMSGADLAIVDINKENATQAVSEIIELFQKTYPDQPKPNVTAHYADISLISDVESSIKDIISKHGRIDNLVACAGFCENVAAVEMKPERLRRLLSVNVEGTFFYATAVARHLMERKAPGNMVFIGSISGSIVNVPQPQAVYNASKAAVRHLGASLAVEWAEKGIRVNVLSPGYMLTEIALKAKILVDNPELRTRWEASIPQGKMGAPDTLMGAVTFLSSDASAYITGQEIKVDGGYTVC